MYSFALCFCAWLIKTEFLLWLLLPQLLLIPWAYCWLWDSLWQRPYCLSHEHWSFSILHCKGVLFLSWLQQQLLVTAASRCLNHSWLLHTTDIMPGPPEPQLSCLASPKEVYLVLGLVSLWCFFCCLFIDHVVKSFGAKCYMQNLELDPYARICTALERWPQRTRSFGDSRSG